MTRNISFAPSEYYHLYNRGTEKRNIFIGKFDYQRFLTLLYIANGSIAVDLKLQGRTLYEIRDIDRGESLVNICGYVLMPNHFHLLVQQKEPHGISTFMRKLGTGYTMYFNARNERSGVLFQGKFKAKHIIDDVYLQYFLAYIHLNPIKLIEPTWKETGIKDKDQARRYLKKYKYSSFVDYCGQQRIENCIIEKNKMPSTLRMPNDFERSVEEWLQGPTL